VRGPSVGGQTNSRSDVRPSHAIVPRRHLGDHCRRIGPGAALCRPSAFSAAMGSTARLAFESPATFLTPKPVTQPVKVWNQRGTELPSPFQCL
jgi:hypothetical protein